jgi:hypothetical protein
MALKEIETMNEGELQVRFPLSDGGHVIVIPTKPLSSETVGEVIEYLEIYKKILAKRVEREGAAR